MGLEHAPGAGQVLVREDQEALAGPKSMMSSTLICRLPTPILNSEVNWVDLTMAIGVLF